MEKNLDKIEEGLGAGVNLLDQMVVGYNLIMPWRKQRAMIQKAIRELEAAQEALKEVRDEVLPGL